MIVKLLTEHHLEFLSLTGGCGGSSESTLVKMSNCWKSQSTAQLFLKRKDISFFKYFGTKFCSIEKYMMSRRCIFYRSTVVPANSDSDVMFCLQSYQGLIIHGSLVY